MTASGNLIPSSPSKKGLKRTYEHEFSMNKSLHFTRLLRHLYHPSTYTNFGISHRSQLLFFFFERESAKSTGRYCMYRISLVNGIIYFDGNETVK